MEPQASNLNRRLLRAELGLLTVLALTVALAWYGGSDASPDGLIRAERIQLVDATGRVRIELRHDAQETGLFIMDDEGQTRLGAAQFAHGGGGFALHGPGARGTAVLYLQGDGSLTFYDADGAIVDRFPDAGG